MILTRKVLFKSFLYAARKLDGLAVTVSFVVIKEKEESSMTMTLSLMKKSDSVSVFTLKHLSK